MSAAVCLSCDFCGPPELVPFFNMVVFMQASHSKAASLVPQLHKKFDLEAEEIQHDAEEQVCARAHVCCPRRKNGLEKKQNTRWPLECCGQQLLLHSRGLDKQMQLYVCMLVISRNRACAWCFATAC